MTIKTEAQEWARKIWNDEHGTISWSDVPANVREDARRAYRVIAARNADTGKAIERGYNILQQYELARCISARGIREVSLLPLDVGFDVHAQKMRVALPNDGRVLRVMIPAGRLHPGWEQQSPYAIRTNGDVTTITSQHTSFVSEILRMAGYKVSGT